MTLAPKQREIENDLEEEFVEVSVEKGDQILNFRADQVVTKSVPAVEESF